MIHLPFEIPWAQHDMLSVQIVMNGSVNVWASNVNNFFISAYLLPSTQRHDVQWLSERVAFRNAMRFSRMESTSMQRLPFGGWRGGVVAYSTLSTD
ncbi:hypothetical protein CEXT_124531 [Caerostris extrusa]|uniref:Uncharacterized protein n=1 Tax=Caerostris extrusa TaxID=172846 RepID=A0AAV4NAS2_CAEEX|nr:hypothetical protein CEXT_124531 [Caerostris extrusa]